MSPRPFRLASTVLGTPDPPGLAAFYVELLGWRYRDDDHADDPDWVVIKPPPGDGDIGLSFQLETEHVPPVWPAGRDKQQMQRTSTSRWVRTSTVRSNARSVSVPLWRRISRRTWCG